uniref:Transaldolase family protein n=1 Tax=Desertifilum tharense IPPAS B-1220 TaxID=1781255 RepID=A0ACD5GQJ0_9CYAN
MYVDELVSTRYRQHHAPSTIEACADHCDVASRIETNIDEAYTLLESLPDADIELDSVMVELLDEGIDKFIQPFESLMQSLEKKVKQLATV